MGKKNPVWDHTDLMSQTPAHLFTHGGQQGFNIVNWGPLFPESIRDLLHLLGILDGWIVADVLSWLPVKKKYSIKPLCCTKWVGEDTNLISLWLRSVACLQRDWPAKS